MKWGFLLFFAFSSVIEAAMIGNPADPMILEEGFRVPDDRWYSFRGGISANILSKKRLELKSQEKARSASVSLNEGIVDVGWNVRERFLIQLIAGPVFDAKLSWKQSMQMECNRGLSWGARAKLALLEAKETTLGLDFLGGGAEWMHSQATENKIIQNRDSHARLYYWQIGIGLSQHIHFLRPYFGVAIQHITCLIRPPFQKELRFHAHQPIGVFEGCSIHCGSKMFLNVEIRNLFEFAYSFSGELRF